MLAHVVFGSAIFLAFCCSGMKCPELAPAHPDLEGRGGPQKPSQWSAWLGLQLDFLLQRKEKDES